VPCQRHSLRGAAKVWHNGDYLLRPQGVDWRRHTHRSENAMLIPDRHGNGRDTLFRLLRCQAVSAPPGLIEFWQQFLDRGDCPQPIPSFSQTSIMRDLERLFD